MTRRHRVLLGVMPTMTLAACTIDPVGPSSPSARASLDLAPAATSLSATSLTAGSTCSSEPVVSGNSTYIVAYTDLPQCAPPSAPPPSEPGAIAPAPKPDSLSLKLSFQ